MDDAFLERWLEEVLATPGVTGISDLAEARRVLLDDALRALPLVERCAGPVVDVGSGGGTPGIPLAARFPSARSRSSRPSAASATSSSASTARARRTSTVVWGRAEEQPTDAFGVALAKALAKPPVAAELCLPLVAPGGAAILWLGETADRDAVASVAEQLGGRLERTPTGSSCSGSSRDAAGVPAASGHGEEAPSRLAGSPAERCAGGCR